MTRFPATPASPRVPRITRLRRRLIRRELEQQSSDTSGRLTKHFADMIAIGAGNFEDDPPLGIAAELAEPTRPLADSKPRPYELQPESIAIIALLCTIAGFLIGFIVHAKVIA
jgi:hypothetical protein